MEAQQSTQDPKQVAADWKLARIKGALARGATVYISTYTRSWKINAKTAAKFDAAGHPLFKVSNGSLMMASGRSYVCADFCAITVEG